MKAEQHQQIVQVISNFDDSKGYVPYVQDLLSHETFGPIFQQLNNDDLEEVNDLIRAYIADKVNSLDTKGGQLFRRYYENKPEKFRQFRRLNADEANITTDEFQAVGKEIEDEMFKLEGILTHNMIKQEKGLDKVVGAFYNIVHSFFPLFSRID